MCNGITKSCMGRSQREGFHSVPMVPWNLFSILVILESFYQYFMCHETENGIAQHPWSHEELIVTMMRWNALDEPNAP